MLNKAGLQNRRPNSPQTLQKRWRSTSLSLTAVRVRTARLRALRLERMLLSRPPKLLNKRRRSSPSEEADDVSQASAETEISCLINRPE